ncbi:hypothetical protein DFH08DRAFT_975102 [Mycena albidolilacea]|uniref:DUF6534 domain-containing protein n=1 Tax=Mycena albidolilacea TaxID=1033008 RepID=A0AAD6Z6P0_9AGAR|nr:hypothetical protein DFH08DRAFT_975102 [Mycena albidolilacea]
MSDLPPLDAITGALLLGTWASIALYIAEAIQAMYYFRHFKDDDWKLKASFRARAGGDCASIYLYTITHAGDLAYLAKGNFGTPVLIISTGIVAIHVQSFLIIRYWRFTHNTALSVFMGCLALASLASNLETGFVVVFFPDLKDRTKVKISSIVYIITEVAADVLIAASMIWELWRVQSRIRITQRRIKNTLRRIIILSFQSGATAAGITITGLIIFLAHDKTNIAAGILGTLRRVYILSMLLNLNIRKSTRTETSAGTTSGLRTPGGGTVENSKGTISSIREAPSSWQFLVNSVFLQDLTKPLQTGSEAVTDALKSMVDMDNIPEEVEMNSISNKRPGSTDE